MTLIPTTRADPGFNVTRASHVTLAAADLDRSIDFYREIIGLVLTEREGNVAYLRGTEERCHHSLTLLREDGAKCREVGFRMYSEDDLEKASGALASVARHVEWVVRPFQGPTLRVIDPSGVPLEFCARMETRDRMHVRPHLLKGAKALRLDHYQVLVADITTGARFYTDAGFKISEYICVKPNNQLFGIFMHRKNNPFDMVLLERPGPRLHHIGFIVESLQDMLRAADVAGELGYLDNVEHGPGRHGHDHYYFTYLRDPDGHRIELLLPPLQTIDIEDEPRPSYIELGKNTNMWGRPPPTTWIEEATEF